MKLLGWSYDAYTPDRLWLTIGPLRLGFGPDRRTPECAILFGLHLWRGRAAVRRRLERTSGEVMMKDFRLQFPHIIEAWEKAEENVSFQRIAAVTQLMMQVRDERGERALAVMERFKEEQNLGRAAEAMIEGQRVLARADEAAD
jgi:hypothetical protein